MDRSMTVTDVTSHKRVVLTTGRVRGYIEKHGLNPVMDKRLDGVVVLQLASFRKVRIPLEVYDQVVEWFEKQGKEDEA